MKKIVLILISITVLSTLIYTFSGLSQPSKNSEFILSMSRDTPMSVSAIIFNKDYDDIVLHVQGIQSEGLQASITREQGILCSKIRLIFKVDTAHLEELKINNYGKYKYIVDKLEEDGLVEEVSLDEQ